MWDIERLVALNVDCKYNGSLQNLDGLEFADVIVSLNPVKLAGKLYVPNPANLALWDHVEFSYGDLIKFAPGDILHVNELS